MFDKENPEQISIFKCQNGYGMETISASGKDESNPENFVVKRYIANSLEEVLASVKMYFTEGEI